MTSLLLTACLLLLQLATGSSLRGVPGGSSILGMFKGGQGEEGTISSSRRADMMDAVALLEQRLWFWGRWTTKVLPIMHTHAVLRLEDHVLLDVEVWCEFLMKGEGGKVQLERITRTALEGLPKQRGSLR